MKVKKVPIFSVTLDPRAFDPGSAGGMLEKYLKALKDYALGEAVTIDHNSIAGND